MEQTDILRHVVQTFENLSVPYVVVGSIASMAYGETRFTQDIDIIAALTLSDVPGFLSAFPQDEFYLDENSVRDAIKKNFQFNIIHPSSGQKIDVVLPRKDAWGIGQIARRRAVRILPDKDVMIASPEDVILGKLWYFSMGGGDRHLRDIAGILRVTGDGVDRAEVTRWARELGYLDIWEQILAKVDAPDEPPGPGRP